MLLHTVVQSRGIMLGDCLQLPLVHSCYISVGGVLCGSVRPAKGVPNGLTRAQWPVW